jgi:hypothetical protein
LRLKVRDDRYGALADLIFRDVGDPAWGFVVEKVLDGIDDALWVMHRRARHSVQMESDMAGTMPQRRPMGSNLVDSNRLYGVQIRIRVDSKLRASCIT